LPAAVRGKKVRREGKNERSHRPRQKGTKENASARERGAGDQESEKGPLVQKNWNNRRGFSQKKNSRGKVLLEQHLIR